MRGAEVKRDAAGYTEELSRRDIEIVLDPDGMGSSTLNTYPEGILKQTNKQTNKRYAEEILIDLSIIKILSRRDIETKFMNPQYR